MTVEGRYTNWKCRTNYFSTVQKRGGIMIRLICRANKDIYVKPEIFHGAISLMLPDAYHDQGYKKHKHRSIKAHSLVIPFDKRIIPAREPFHLDVRGLDSVLDHIKNYLKQQPYFYISKEITVDVLSVDEFQPKLSDRFKTLTPIILKVPDESLFYKYVPDDYPYLTPEESVVAWEAYAANRLYSKANYLFGSVPDKPIIKIEMPKIAQLYLLGERLKGTYGTITVFGDPFWQEFLFNLGIGDKTTYGFGCLIPA